MKKIKDHTSNSSNKNSERLLRHNLFLKCNVKFINLILFLSLILGNVEVPEFVNVPIFVRSDHSQPISHIVFLQVLLGQVLQISTTDRYKIKSVIVHVPYIYNHFCFIHARVLEAKLLRVRRTNGETNAIQILSFYNCLRYCLATHHQ